MYWVLVRRTKSTTRFYAAVQRNAGAILVSGDAFFNSRRTQITALAARHKLPAIYDRREIAMADGLMSYGP